MNIQSQSLRWIFVGPTNGAGCKTKNHPAAFSHHPSEFLSDQNLPNFPPNTSPGQEHLLSRVRFHLKHCTQKYSQPRGETGTTLNFSQQETQPWLGTEALGVQGVLPRRVYLQIHSTAFCHPLKHCPCSHSTAAPSHPLAREHWTQSQQTKAHWSGLDRWQKEGHRWISFTVCWSTALNYFPVTQTMFNSPNQRMYSFPRY